MAHGLAYLSLSVHLARIPGRISHPSRGMPRFSPVSGATGTRRRVAPESQHGYVTIRETGQNHGTNAVIPAEAGIQKPRAAKYPA